MVICFSVLHLGEFVIEQSGREFRFLGFELVASKVLHHLTQNCSWVNAACISQLADSSVRAGAIPPSGKFVIKQTGGECRFLGSELVASRVLNHLTQNCSWVNASCIPQLAESFVRAGGTPPSGHGGPHSQYRVIKSFFYCSTRDCPAIVSPCSSVHIISFVCGSRISVHVSGGWR